MRTFLAIWCLFVGVMGGAHAAVHEIAEANMTLTVDGGVPSTRRVVLPYDWDRVQGPQTGEAKFVLRVPWDRGAQPMGIHIPRVGNQYSVKVNGHELFRSNDSAHAAPDELISEPALLAIPHWALTDLSEVEIAIVAIPGKYGGLSPVVWGPVEEIRPQFIFRRFLEVTSRRVLGAVTAMLSMFGLLMWVRLREKPYLSYGLSEALWTVLTLRTLADQALLPWPWMPYLFYKLPLMLSISLMYQAMLPLLGVESGRLKQAIHASTLAAPFMALLAAMDKLNWLTQAFMGILLSFVFVLAWISVRNAWRDRQRGQIVMASVFMVLLLSGARDGYVFILSNDAYVSTSWLRFAWIALGLSFGWIAVERFRNADATLKQLNASLSQELASRSAELRSAFERERQAEKERGAMEERQRLMRDLHDGLGSQLAGALRIAQTPTASKAELTAQLREAIDHMKVTVDAMQETDGDIPSMLGAVRYRLTPRLKAAGIALEWDVQRLPAMPNWTVKQAYQLQMLLLEAFTNMMMHSDATTGRLTAALVQGESDSHIEICVADNGKGFDVAAISMGGSGLKGMQMRAQTLGATLEITSQAGQTSVVLRLPFSDISAT